MVIGCLAVWKAGAAYLPMDPRNPAPRLEFLARDAGISALIVADNSEKSFPSEPRPTIALNELGMIVKAPTGTRTTGTPAKASDDLAYVLYTSGSTGDPNGVEVTHKNLLNLVAWHEESFHLTPEDRGSQVANVGFDAAGWEIWPCLAAGACVCIPGDDVTIEPESFRDWVVNERITISFIPTPMAELMLRLRWPAKLALRIMLTGGDTLRRYPGEGLPFELINNYGPTECTVVATSGRILPEDLKHEAPSIGLPIANTQVYILDESGRQVASGALGEIYIGGAGVARGYRNRPELTAERFVPDPFAGRGRLFKTGDIGRRLPDGRIAFVGRAHDQIKVRGFRLEPNEISAAINQHPGVLQSQVVARQDGDGDTRLIGYLVLAEEGAPAPTELRDFLKARLPEYMVPEIFVRLESLPLSPNGKVDRALLPAPTEENTLRDQEITAPRTDVEKTVANMLGTLLGTDRVDVEGNFFVLGGHSLVGAQLIARIRNTYGVEMSLRVLYEGPTVAQLALEIERMLALKERGIRQVAAEHKRSSCAS
jgi:amino acid adenylation domain-containing protein